VSGAVRARLGLLAGAALGCGAALAQQARPALGDCAAIEDPTRRLQCYDAAAGRPAAPTAPVVPAAAPTPAPVAAAPAAAARADSPQAFGLYPVEHPKPVVAQTLTAKVVTFGRSSQGRPTVTLEGGQVWELLDDADPLLAPGDAVTVRRAALGSFVLDTPSKRTHRVHRLQ
jgi:hypothetical protein